MAKIGRFLSPERFIFPTIPKPDDYSVAIRNISASSAFIPALPSDDHQIMNFILIVIEWFLVFDLLIIISLSWWKSQHSTAASPSAREKTKRELNSRNNWNFLWEWYSKLLLFLMLLMNAVVVIKRFKGLVECKDIHGIWKMLCKC